MKSIRGATTVTKNSKEEILESTEKLLIEILSQNNIEIEHIVSIFFTMTKDLDKVYPAVSARNIGITEASLMCMQELYVENSLQKCIRVMININSEKKQSEMKHIYLKGAKVLRKDIVNKEYNMLHNIAIDGPSGAGKSTIAKIVSKKLNCIYVDTGAMYRSVALYIIENNINKENKEDIIKALENIKIELDYLDGVQNVFLNGNNVTDKIREEEVGKIASKNISVIKEVRETLVKMQQHIAKEKSVVMDGRDIGSVVLPNAFLKIYLDAKSYNRAKRRFDELQQKGVNVNFDEILKEIEKRDFDDKNREESPLIKCDDAIYVDTSNIGIEEVSEKILSLYKKKVQEN